MERKRQAFGLRKFVRRVCRANLSRERVLLKKHKRERDRLAMPRCKVDGTTTPFCS